MFFLRILWPLLVYEMPISTVDTLEKKVTGHLSRWLGRPRSLSCIALYRHCNKLPIPLKSLKEGFKVTRAREGMQSRKSSNLKVAIAGIEVRTGRKWKAEEAVQQAELRLHHKRLVGVVTRQNCFGLLFHPQHEHRQREGETSPRPGGDEGSSRRKEILQDSGNKEQGAWTRWENAIKRKVTWSRLWKAEPQRFKFLHAHFAPKWHPQQILSCCPKVLGKGRSRWSHDQVLKVIAEPIVAAVKWAKIFRPSKRAITFIRAREQPRRERRTSAGFLASARDWQLLKDLERQLKL